MKSAFLIACACACFIAHAQEKIYITITDARSGRPMPAVIILHDNSFAANTDTAGHATVSIAAGRHVLSFLFTGYRRIDTAIVAPGIKSLTIALRPAENDLNEVTVVASTRNNASIENSPIKVEVLGTEELNEEAGIKPGNINSILGDVSGVQVQQSSATSGNSNVRIQGLDGRYTQIIRDGMPLYEGFSGGFGILTIPPLDLRQIELIKGASSTLYGGGAIGGLINLISKRPTFQRSVDALVNYTSLNEFNTNVYTAKRNDKLGYTLFAGYTSQKATDVNNDGLSDVPVAGSFIVHPHLFWYPSSHTTVSIGYTGTFDDRKGGDMQVLNGHADSMHRYYERNNTTRHTGDYSVEHSFNGNMRLTVKGNVSNYDRAIYTDTYTFRGTQLNYFHEASLYIPQKNNSLVLGMDLQGDNYRTTAPSYTPLQSFSDLTVGVFGLYSLHIHEHTTIDAGLRVDHHDTYGTFPLPQLAAFHRFSGHWACRAGFGMGYKIPDPFAPQNIDYTPISLLPRGQYLLPEQSVGGNVEVNYKKEWDEDNSIFVNEAVFVTSLMDPLLFTQNAAGYVALTNATSPVVTGGSDTYIKITVRPWEIYAGYTFTDAHATYLPSNADHQPLTPAHRAAFVVTREVEKKWRFGLEGSYIGAQYRYDATTTPGYFLAALMVQRNIGAHITLVLNGENLLDYRMSREETLYTGSISAPQFKPLWAPIDGRVVNLSVRWKL